mmetsp:Transcript_8770/g.26011  ORF Transcript_8770/g.26011 Transcript_8770/m.26011 type:complete len:210 (-) Transcript_8770:287-916(-)
MQERRLQNLSQFFHRLLGSTDIVVRHIGLVLYGHETHGGIDLGREWNLDRVFGTIDSDPHALLDIGRGYLFSQSHHKLGNLLDVDDVLVGSLCVAVAAAAAVPSRRGSSLRRFPGNDFRAPGHLEGSLFRHHLLVAHQIPHGRRRQSRVALFDSDEVLHLRLVLFDFFLKIFDECRVGSESVGFQEGNIALVQGRGGVLFVLILVIVSV